MIHLLITLNIIQILILAVVLVFVIKPKIIEITKNPEGIKSTAIMTPSGTFMRVDKREPVVNDDETLFLREE